ncbi:choice-of-anchor E domain-containing protein [Oceanicoccus sp. KOV_DT_Chl]|uniref:choice-of-anchor E domain-containing protein n=1 Tax=Oceanicoccus sp. KOV_DT_Chl TaxID=1904639 RepID=UPI00190F024D|nr:choice-of-anchor E domain-containing protein [Oceanicoccus sp. KOV_DT_Chl]
MFTRLILLATIAVLMSVPAHSSAVYQDYVFSLNSYVIDSVADGVSEQSTVIEYFDFDYFDASLGRLDSVILDFDLTISTLIGADSDESQDPFNNVLFYHSRIVKMNLGTDVPQSPFIPPGYLPPDTDQLIKNTRTLSGFAAHSCDPCGYEMNLTGFSHPSPGSDQSSFSSILSEREDIILFIGDGSFQGRNMLAIEAEVSNLLQLNTGYSFVDSTFEGSVGLTYNYSAVPVPAAFWLFSSALIGLAGLKRKK